MLFNTVDFAIFFVIVFSLYWALNHKWQNIMLLLASCIFYSAWNWKFLFLIFLSVSTDYVCSTYIARSNDPAFRRKLLALSIIVNLSILAFFKYFNFFVDNLAALLAYFHLSVPTIYLKIILPLGISFYTFEAISYVVDVYRKETRPAKNFLDYAIFILYFPHLIAGPIMRAKDFLPQVESPRIFTWLNFKEGCYLFFWGLFQKSFIADNIAKLVNPVFASQAPYEGSQVLLALYAFAFQIYCDFNGYSNMARGLGKTMGFDLTNNFALPYFSTNPQEFWRRWHISLSTWLRDYVYIPLGGNQSNIFYTCRNLLITMLIAGIWHGAAWTFVVWGAYHGVLIVTYHIFKRSKEAGALTGPFFSIDSSQKIQPRNNTFRAIFKIIIFFHAICLGWLMFRSTSMSQFVQMAQSVFFNFHLSPELLNGIKHFLFCTWLLLLVEVFQKIRNDLLIVLKLPFYFKWPIMVIMFYSLAVWSDPGQEEFIYFFF